MAVTGAGLFGFAFAHMLGNLQIFLGPEPLNRYAHFLQSNTELLWSARLGLLGMVGLHIWSAFSLTRENRAAREVAYAVAPHQSSPVDRDRKKSIASRLAARTMILSGLIILTFVFYHLLHFTWKVPQINGVPHDFEAFFVSGEDFKTPLEKDLGVEGSNPHDVYKMLVRGFEQPVVVVFYLLAVGLLCLHLSHGIGAMFQSLGWKSKAFGIWIDRLACWGSLLLFLGYAAVPLGVWAGIVKFNQ